MFKKLIALLLVFAVLENSAVATDCTVLHKITDNTCGELCLSSYISPFAIQFGGVTEGDCKTLGYTVYDHKESVSVGPFGSFEVTVYNKTASILSTIFSLGDSSDCVQLYKLEENTCGQVCLSSYIAPFAQKFGGVTPGSCSALGFSTFKSTQKVSMGPFGEVSVEIYVKASAFLSSFTSFFSEISGLNLSDECTNLFRVVGDTCGQVCLPANLVELAEKLQGVTLGECSLNGYTVLKYTQTLDEGAYGKFKVDIYSQ